MALAERDGGRIRRRRRSVLPTGPHHPMRFIRAEDLRRIDSADRANTSSRGLLQWRRPRKKQDHSVVAVVEKKEGQVNMIHMKQFKLGTEYSHVMGYLNRLGQRLQTVKRTLIDQ